MPVSAEIKSLAHDANTGNIVINVEYVLPDGSRVLNPYFANFQNFIGLTPSQIETWIFNQINFQCDRYLEAKDKNAGVNSELISKSLSPLIGKTTTKDKVTWIRTNNNNVVTPYLASFNYAPGEKPVKQIDIAEDGAITETPLEK